MANKKDAVEAAGTEEKPDSQRGLSKESWIAIGTIVAALITGIVTLLIHVLPQAPRSQAPPSQSSTPPASPSSRPVPTGADAIVGKWAGMAQDSNGTRFQVTLEIKKPCSPNEPCGSISVSHVPCYGEVFLVKAEDNDFEFRVDNFDGKSNRTICQPGAGEHFRLRPDGKVTYTTTYEPVAQGTLERIRD
jgi:hypothetical protein